MDVVYASRNGSPLVCDMIHTRYWAPSVQALVLEEVRLVAVAAAAAADVVVVVVVVAGRLEIRPSSNSRRVGAG